MKYQGLRAILVVVLLLAGCSGTSLLSTPQPAGLVPLAGSSLDGVNYELNDGRATVSIDRLSTAGSFFRIETEARPGIGSLTWSSDTVLAAAFAVGRGAEIGVVPLAAYGGEPVTLELELTTAPRTASVPPVGDYNTINLEIADAGVGQVRLSWIQINVGDYNFDGLVNVSDLTPIGQLFNHSYSRTGLGADLQREYWVDGNGDGVINVSDITPIGQNYGAFVAGYNVRHNGLQIDGTPTVEASTAQLRPGLPPLYDVVLPGAPSDDWAVVAVDAEGVEGSGSGDIVGDINLRANVNLSGIDLLDLTGGNPGPFDPGKIGQRVIDPIEIIDSARFDIPSIGSISTSGAASTFSGLPAGQTLLLDVYYLPTVDLATGNPRTPASLHTASAVDESEYVICSVPFKLPGLEDMVDIDLEIEIEHNPDGGYFVIVTAVVTMPGDNPATPAVENGYTLTYHMRLDYATGLLSNDTDANGSFEDEAELDDSDRDCVSEPRLEQQFDDDRYDKDDRAELEIQGVIAAFDEAAGLITLSGAFSEENPGLQLPDPLVLEFSELSRFEERIRTDTEDIEQDLDPSSLTAGEDVEVSLYRLDDSDGSLPDKYWIEEIKRVIDNRSKDD